MPFKAGNPMPVTVATGLALSGPAQPVYVVNAPPAVAGRARRVVAVTGGPIKNGAAIPVYNAGAGALYTDDPPIPVYVVSGSLGGVAPSTLLTGLSLYLKLDEAGGTRADALGGVTPFTDNNTALSAAGQVGSAAAFVAASAQYLSHASVAALQTGDIDLEVSGWFNATTLAVNNDIAGKLATAGEFEWFIESSGATNFRFGVSNNGTSITGDLNVTVSAFSIATWYCFDCWHDSVSNSINFRINNGTTQTLSYSGGVRAGASSFDIGRGVAGRYFNGLIDDFKFWKRLLTDAERTENYANGLAGRALL